jgi:Pentapeptide repeats (9 copies)
MEPAVVAAMIAAGVSVLTLIGTLAAQYFGRRATSGDTEKALDRTLAEQRKELDRTLAEQRTRTLNERFATAADKLGDDKPPAVRLAGVYAMAGLADDWKKNRQTCIDVLCGYLRMPYEPDPGEQATPSEWLAFRADREVRHTVIRIIAAHIREGAAKSWQGLDFDFTGVVFDGGDFTHANFSGGEVDFTNAVFSSGNVDFGNAVFAGGKVNFLGAKFTGGTVGFDSAEFAGGLVWFDRAEFSGGTVDFSDAKFISGYIGFSYTTFIGSTVRFDSAAFSGSRVDFIGDLADAKLSDGTVDFSNPRDWRHPPAFPWTSGSPLSISTPPPSVKLPEKEHQSQV